MYLVNMYVNMKSVLSKSWLNKLVKNILKLNIRRKKCMKENIAKKLTELK